MISLVDMLESTLKSAFSNTKSSADTDLTSLALNTFDIFGLSTLVKVTTISSKFATLRSAGAFM